MQFQPGLLSHRRWTSTREQRTKERHGSPELHIRRSLFTVKLLTPDMLLQMLQLIKNTSTTLQESILLSLGEHNHGYPWPGTQLIDWIKPFTPAGTGLHQFTLSTSDQSSAIQEQALQRLTEWRSPLSECLSSMALTMSVTSSSLSDGLPPRSSSLPPFCHLGLFTRLYTDHCPSFASVASFILLHSLLQSFVTSEPIHFYIPSYIPRDWALLLCLHPLLSISRCAYGFPNSLPYNTLK